MPWSAKDATSHTKAAKTPAQKAKWARVANGILAKSDNEGKAVRLANWMMHRGSKTKAKGK